MKYLGVAAIKIYQLFISPLFPSSCRFYPSCSEYTLQSIEKFGLFKGAWKGFVRLAKCHPFHSGGYDPVK
ncbi:membrane protein insertion efficiency factor YidD [candidate division KSB1 bacterium]|nr:membrane protein insertion efficiency factor YidD [candidate division KSB1 bacterium]MCH8019430.1 membrane protein insertion efficiency factor YidD [candidate division KSB1 bacterium]